MDDDFDDEELEELLEEIAAEEDAQDAGVPRTRFRATYRDGRLLVLPRGDGLAEQGPILTMLEGSGCQGLVIADLAESSDNGPLGGWELTVTVLTPDELSREAEAAILGWAGNVGFRRAWLPDRVVKLGARRSFHSKARVHCENCGQNWRNSGRRFWQGVTHNRSFPTYCLLCGADLPAWEVERVEPKRRWHCRDPS